MKKYKLGYTTGVFDLFHIGHLNILKESKRNCEKLIVGVTKDELCVEIKGKSPVIPFQERLEIIKSIKYVDLVIEQEKIDELDDFSRLKFDLIIKGDDWQGSEKWIILEKEFVKVGVDVLFLPYTKTTSSTKLRNALEKL